MKQISLCLWIHAWICHMQTDESHKTLESDRPPKSDNQNNSNYSDVRDFDGIIYIYIIIYIHNMIIYIILYADMQKKNMDTFYEYEIIIICRKYIKIHVYDIYMYDTFMYNIEIQFTVPGLVRSRKQDLLKGRVGGATWVRNHKGSNGS